MKKMHRYLALILVIILALTLVACGGGGNNNAQAPAPAPSSQAPAPAPSSQAPAPAPSSQAPAPAPSQPPVDNTVYEFTFADENAPNSSMAGVYDKWADDLRELTNGRIDVVIYYGGVLGPNAEYVNMIETGSIDSCVVGVNHQPGRFPLSEVFNVPTLQYQTSLQVAKAHEYLVNTNNDVANEVSGFKVIGYRANNKTPISHKGAPWTSINDLKGVKVNASSIAVTAFVNALGMVPVNVPLPDRYESMSKNVIDAVTTDWNALESFTLFEVVNSIMDVSVTIQVNFVGVSWDAWNKLPADLQDILMDRSSTLAEDFYAMMSEVERNGADKATGLGITVYQPDASVLAAFQPAYDAASQAYIEYLEGKYPSYDGASWIQEVQSALDRFK